MTSRKFILKAEENERVSVVGLKAAETEASSYVLEKFNLKIGSRGWNRRLENLLFHLSKDQQDALLVDLSRILKKNIGLDISSERLAQFVLESDVLKSVYSILIRIFNVKKSKGRISEIITFVQSEVDYVTKSQEELENDIANFDNAVRGFLFDNMVEIMNVNSDFTIMLRNSDCMKKFKKNLLDFYVYSVLNSEKMNFWFESGLLSKENYSFYLSIEGFCDLVLRKTGVFVDKNALIKQIKTDVKDGIPN